MKESSEMVNIFNTTDFTKNPDLDINKLMKARNMLWERAKDVLKEGLKINSKNSYFKQEIKNLKELKKQTELLLITDT